MLSLRTKVGKNVLFLLWLVHGSVKKKRDNVGWGPLGVLNGFWLYREDFIDVQTPKSIG
jgi:hypothetical protein